MNQFDALHLAMFSGKGGVGKTTLACGFARHWAIQFPHEKILLLSTDPAHSLGDVLLMAVNDQPNSVGDLPNLTVRELNAANLLKTFKDRYGKVLELIVERGSFVQNDDLSPVWDLGFPGMDELMSILEIQRILQSQEADRVVVDMAPSGHTLNLFGLMDFLEEFLSALELFQEKHRVISQTFTGRYSADEADEFLDEMRAELIRGRHLLQNGEFTTCLVVAIAETMSLLETKRFLAALETLQIPVGGLVVNHILEAVGVGGQESGVTSQERKEGDPRAKQDLISLARVIRNQVVERKQEDCNPFLSLDRYAEQQRVLADFLDLAGQKAVFIAPQQSLEPVGAIALDHLIARIYPVSEIQRVTKRVQARLPEKITPGFCDFMAEDKRLLIVGGKGGVGKTTVAAAIAWKIAERYQDKTIRIISIDPAHSLGDAFGQLLGHKPIAILPNLTGQEVDAVHVLDQFREEYLWELAEMMSGESSNEEVTLQVAYGPEAWRRIVAQALPGIDEMLALVTVMELLESGAQDLIVLDTAPTGHLLRFLEMPTAMSDWLAWLFKLWIKYQDVLGHTDFIGRLRSLRQRVVQAQRNLTNPAYTEFIGVTLAESAVIAEAQRLSATLNQMGINQRYIVHNCFEPRKTISAAAFAKNITICLPPLPHSLSSLQRIQGAADLLFE